ncbi:MAG: low molecular weight phosphotyrosine protein phosphatase, partial [Oscillospiraceae bacterium]|nr:low molecular weight phosphotyrosine protein phosphatase [Oscillospiraceae bacterium]
ILRRKGIPCENRHAVQIRKSDYAAYDYIIAMEQFNLRNMRHVIGSDPDQKVYRMLDFTEQPRDVSDPWFSGDFESAYSDISRGCAAFLEYLEGRGLL